MNTKGLYIHIPFCKSRCIYCDFYSTVQGKSAQKAYVAALAREMNLRASYLTCGDGYGIGNEGCNSYDSTAGKRPWLDSVYIGGGTPSVMGSEELGQLFETIAANFQISQEAEITIEANPDDVNESFARTIASLPINRVSMGVQTFDDNKLHLLRRRHTAAQVARAISLLNSVGITNVSIDLIYGLPNQTLEQWKSDLDQAFALPITHLSAYALIYEDGTELSRMRDRGEVIEADEEMSLQMFETLMLKANEEGFNHYEVSNFGRPTLEARHNSGYWHGMHYLGIGPGAHSYNGTSRQSNNADLNAYLLAQGDVEGANLCEKELLTTQLQKEESVMSQLRTAAGIDLNAYRRNYGQAALDALLHRAQPFLDAKQLTLEQNPPHSFAAQANCHANSSATRLCMTRSGVFVSDGIMVELFD